MDAMNMDFNLSQEYDDLEFPNPTVHSPLVSQLLISGNDPMLTESHFLDNCNVDYWPDSDSYDNSINPNEIFVEPMTTGFDDTINTIVVPFGQLSASDKKAVKRCVTKPKTKSKQKIKQIKSNSRRPGRPSLNRSIEDQKKATKDINKTAAQRYRQRKLDREKKIQSEIDLLENNILNAKKQMDELLTKINHQIEATKQLPKNSRNKFFREYEEFKRHNTGDNESNVES